MMLLTNWNQKKSLNDYDEDHMLIEYNPFKTNTLSLYVYFNTEEATKVSYTVSKGAGNRL